MTPDRHTRIQIGGEARLVPVRVARMVAWLMSNADQVCAPKKVQVSFDCAGSSILAEVRRQEDVQGL